MKIQRCKYTCRKCHHDSTAYGANHYSHSTKEWYIIIQRKCKGCGLIWTPVDEQQALNKAIEADEAAMGIEKIRYVEPKENQRGFE